MNVTPISPRLEQYLLVNGQGRFVVEYSEPGPFPISNNIADQLDKELPQPYE